jgi:hypothetical protein
LRVLLVIIRKEHATSKPLTSGAGLFVGSILANVMLVLECCGIPTALTQAATLLFGTKFIKIIGT